MANKAISELPQAQNVNNQDLFVLEQSGIAKKLTAETFITEQGIIDALAEALDGHGGIQSVTLSSVSGRIRTYRITFTDQSATTFQVYDGTSIDRISRTSSSGLDDVYTIFLSDGTTTFFTVHNGADGNVSEAMLNDALKDKAPAITETTESSAIANFTDGADDMPIKSLVADIDPVQDLHGYDAPWPAGSGKNLAKPFTYTNNNHVGTTVVYAGDGSCEIDGTASSTSGTPNISTATQNGYTITLPAGTYTISISGQTTNVSAEVYDISTVTSLATLTLPTFTLSNETTVLFRCAVSGGSTYSHQKVYMQLESGSSATSYAPYSNICPITGHTEVNVTRTGKNLLDPTYRENIYSNIRYYMASENGLVLPAGDYVFSISEAPASLTVKNKVTNENIRVTYSQKNTSFTLAEQTEIFINAYYSTIPSAGLASVNCQLELGSTATTHEPYQGNTVTVDWQTEAGTVYGGTIDVATGLLTVEYAKLDNPSSFDWQYEANYAGGLFRFRYANNFKSNGKLVCSMYPYKGIYSQMTNNSCGYIFNNHFAIKDDSYNGDVSAFKSGIADMELIYELATPQTYQLTGQQLKTLLGTNNVWADTGNVSVTYPADTKMFIEKLTMPTEDDLVANRAITSGKYFMVGNSLYLALANIASGAQITIGTNAQRVSLADALNTINS